jgi:glycosyltransferase involved in cell wall biosynthesis
LEQTLLSLLNQTFTDFEIIVGNDYVDETITAETFGIKDPRIRFVNNTRNIGELENMNSLLGMAQGKYFTWQFDDDPVSLDFLQATYSALKMLNSPTCVFTSYSHIYGIAAHRYRKVPPRQAKLFSGKDFLRGYLSGRVKTMGCCGFYNSDYLRKIGGVHRLTDGPMALYSENLIIIGVGLLPEVAYIKSPLVSTRVHKGSWTCANNDVALFKEAGLNLIKESIAILSRSELKEDFRENILSILNFAMGSVVTRSVIRDKRVDNREIDEYASAITKEFEPLRGTVQYQYAVSGLEGAIKNVPKYVCRTKIKMLMPPGCLRFVHMARSFILQHTK